MGHFPGHKKTTETPYLEALVDLIQSLQLHPLPSPPPPTHYASATVHLILSLK